MVDNKVVGGKNYYMIDFCKIICALLVVIIHSVDADNYSLSADIIKRCFARQAVPYFFMASGLFFGKKLFETKNKRIYVRQYVLNLLLLYFIWMLLCCHYLAVPTFKNYIEYYESYSLLYKCFLFIRYIFVTGGGVEWYLLIMAQSAIIIALFVKIKKEKILYILSILGIFLYFTRGIDVSVFYYINRIIDVLFISSNSAVILGIPCMTFGLFLSQITSLNINRKLLFIIYTIVGLMQVSIYFFAYATSNDMLYKFIVFGPILAGILFLLSYQTTSGIVQKKYVILREMSSTMYFMHTVFIFEVIKPIFGKAINAWLIFFISVILSILTYLIVKRINNRYVNWLLNIK